MNALFHRRSKGPGHEERDVSSRLILLTTLALFGGVGFSLLVVFGILRLLERQTHAPSTPLALRQERLGPRLEVSPSVDRKELQDRAQGQLQAYGWTDKATRTAHIPIDRAMAILKERGWPDQDKTETGR